MSSNMSLIIVLRLLYYNLSLWQGACQGDEQEICTLAILCDYFERPGTNDQNVQNMLLCEYVTLNRFLSISRGSGCFVEPRFMNWKVSAWVLRCLRSVSPSNEQLQEFSLPSPKLLIGRAESMQLQKTRLDLV